MSQGFSRVAYINSHLSRSAIVPALQKILILFCPGAQGNEKRPRIQNRCGDLPDQIVALLRHQARDDSDDRPIEICGQAKPAQQIKFAFLFAGDVACGKVGCNMRIRLWIPEICIDSISNSAQAVTACSQQPVETVTLLRSLNLLGITATDGR